MPTEIPVIFSYFRYITLVLVLTVAGCTGGDPATPSGADSTLLSSSASDTTVRETEMGEATYYADTLDRMRTASGEMLDQNDLVAAHRRYPFGTLLRVTNLENARSVVVRVIDRGPFGAPKKADEKVIDLSRRAADQLDFVAEGRAVVRVEVLDVGPGLDTYR